MNLKDYLIKNISDFDFLMYQTKQKIKTKTKITKDETKNLQDNFTKYSIYREVYTKILSDLENKIITTELTTKSGIKIEVK